MADINDNKRQLPQNLKLPVPFDRLWMTWDISTKTDDDEAK